MNISAAICQRFNLSSREFARFVNTCPYRYKTYPIKRRQSAKMRWISQPSRELKAVQRFVIAEFLEPNMRIHDAAKAYRCGMNITDNARPHLSNEYLLKMDFADFFPSIKAQDFTSYLLGHELVPEDEAKLLAKLFFKADDLGYLHLSIGSPGSPLISNALLFDFDEAVSDMSKQDKVAYSRYSDDLTFSTNTKNVLFEFPDRIAAIIAELASPALSINETKTVFSSRRHNRHVTGITITNEGQMSIGRSRKRQLRSRVFRANELDDVGIASLRGQLAFVNQIESDFITKLKLRYPNQMLGVLGFSENEAD